MPTTIGSSSPANAPKLIGALANKRWFTGRVAQVELKEFANGMSGVGLQLLYHEVAWRGLTDAALSDLPLVNAVFTGFVKASPLCYSKQATYDSPGCSRHC